MGHVSELAPPRKKLSPASTGRGPAGPKPALQPATERPIARVSVDLPLAHLDRPFDYLVPAALSEAAQRGVRVRVRFAGQLVGGFVLDRLERTEHDGALAFLHKVVSPEPVLSTEIAALSRLVADRYAGTMSDVLRLAVPPRHARVEAEPAATPSPAGGRPAGGDPVSASSATDVWRDYDGGAGLIAALRKGWSPRVVWSALPTADWPAALAAAAQETLASGRGSVIVVPDGRDVARVSDALARVEEGQHITLTADLGPAERYRRFLAIRRGGVQIVVGTRSAMFAPIHRLGLAVVWDDGDDLHAEPHAPYPHVRKVLALRSVSEGAGVLLGGFTCSAEGAQLLAENWARPVQADRAIVRRTSPSVPVAGADSELARDQAARSARLPSLALRAARDSLQLGPVLVQVPRHGYAPSLACDACRSPARCLSCAGPLASASARAQARCRWCGASATAWECPTCGARRLRAVVVGGARTAEELGRAFPRVRVRTSDRDGVLATVGPEPALVVATPGAEPVAEGGYAGALLLDGWALLARPDLRAGEEALRRWLNAAALVRPAAAGGVVVIHAEPSHPAVQALVRWDPVTYAERELRERAVLRLPPTVRMAALTGEPEGLRRFLELAELPEPVDVLGPVPTRAAGNGVDGGGRDAEAGQRLLMRVPLWRGDDLVAAVRAAAGVRSAHKESGSVRLQIDPLEVA